MVNNNTVKKDNIISFENSYKQTQYVSALIVSVCSLAFFWDLQENDFNNKNFTSIRIGFILIFIVFCINIYVIHSISNHVSRVYTLVSGAERNNPNEREQTNDAYKYHIDKRKRMSYTIGLFRLSLAILVIAVCLIIISKHSILDKKHSIFLVLISIITIIGIYT